MFHQRMGQSDPVFMLELEQGTGEQGSRISTELPDQPTLEIPVPEETPPEPNGPNGPGGPDGSSGPNWLLIGGIAGAAVLAWVLLRR